MTTDNTLQDLLPCPFCGAKGIWDRVNGHDAVACSNDNCDASVQLYESATWNSRAQPAPGVVETLRAARTQIVQLAEYHYNGVSEDDDVYGGYDPEGYAKIMCFVHNGIDAALAALPAPNVGEIAALLEKAYFSFTFTNEPDVWHQQARALIAAGVIRGV